MRRSFILNEQEIVEACVKYIESRFNIDEQVTGRFNIENQSVGYGPAETTKQVLSLIIEEVTE